MGRQWGWVVASRDQGPEGQGTGEGKRSETSELLTPHSFPSVPGSSPTWELLLSHMLNMNSVAWVLLSTGTESQNSFVVRSLLECLSGSVDLRGLGCRFLTLIC